MNTKYCLFLLLFLGVILNIEAQVVIGSGSTALSIQPQPGALLEIKMQDPDSQNITSTKGLMIPRVALTAADNLAPCVVGATDAQKLLHKGLTVYNTTYGGTLLPAIYSWDGQKWMLLDQSVNPLYNPNSYIVKPGQFVEIPVSKAYAFWESYSTPDFVNEKLTGAVTAELLWQDTQDLISAGNITLLKGDQGYNTIIKLSTDAAKGSGNAVIVVKIGGTIRWSWHIWITGYNPLVNAKTYKGLTFMDRNLGASNTTIGDLGSLGLLYQWGRNMPFPGANQTIGNGVTLEPVIYGNVTTIDKTVVAVKNNLANAVLNPSTFYLSTGNFGDWYSNVLGFRNDSLWLSTNKTKGIFDPCPAGWKVPWTAPEPTSSPWYDLGNPGFVAGTGITWAELGYYPSPGYRNQLNGVLTNVGYMGTYWNSTGKGGSDNLAFTTVFYNKIYGSTDIITYNFGYSRAMGNSVRCVRIQ